MDFHGNFRLIGRYVSMSLERKILNFDESSWNSLHWQDSIGKEYRCTQAIPVLFDKDFRHVNPTRHSAFMIVGNAFRDLERIMKDYYCDEDGYFVRMIIVKMDPSSEIPLHCDTGSSLPYSHRVHLPIKTDFDAIFEIDGELRNMRKFELWEINNQREHGVRNLSREARIHIIMDWVTSDLVRLRKQELGIEIDDVCIPPKEGARPH